MTATSSLRATSPSASPLSDGLRVAVQTRSGQWSSGFEIAEITSRGYRLRRISDGAVLPFDFELDELRPDPVHGSVQCPDCGLTLADWPVPRYAATLIRRHRELGYCEA
jgi:hypothetical protein